MKSTDELHSAIRASETPALLAGAEFARPELSSTLSRLLEERGWRAADAIRACYLERSYGYQMFNGTRPPTRNFLLRLALALELGEEEAQRLLLRAGRPELYPRSRADAAVLYGLTHRLSLEETDELLLSLGGGGAAVTHTEQFCREYRAVLDGLELPERVGLVYEPEALLSERGGRSVWKLRRRCERPLAL